MLHVKVTVKYIISFKCNIYFLNSTIFYLSTNLIETNFRVSFAVEYIMYNQGSNKSVLKSRFMFFMTYPVIQSCR